MDRRLPSGIVTFLFTDIEGSTRLFHRLGDRYVGLLDRHRQIIEDAVDAAGGVEISVEGDSVFAAFGRADDALKASRDAQRRLTLETWPDDVSVRVRMGIHSGLASPREGDYVALAVHQANRVMAAGHGGQVLVSADTAALLSTSEDLLPLGRYRLRDFDEPLHLYQLPVEGPGGEIPAIRAVPADGHNLARPLTSTIGRDDLIAGVAEELVPGRLVTLIGPGGVGKTRVAVDVGIRIAPGWTDGVWRVDLAEVAEESLVAAAIGEAVGAPSAASDDRWDAILEYLYGRQMVVVLDNCEHVIAACRDAARSILGTCSGVAVLATSREPLKVAGERLRQVRPLSVARGPDSDARSVADSPAVRLFVERARAVDPDFEVTPDNASLVRAISERLDGLPLFLELAAAQLAFRSPEEILAGLEDRFRLLRSHDPASTGRHRTAHALLEWSYRLLDEQEQAAFRRLSIFGAGFSIDTAGPAIGVGAIDGEGAADLVWSLVERSLIFPDPTANETRYRLLETVRAFGRSLLGPEEAASAARRLAMSFLQRIGPWLPADRSWVGAVRYELGNLRAVLEFLGDADEPVAQQIACSIGRYHDASQSFREGIEEVGRYVETLGTPSAVRVSLLTTLADLYLRTGDVESARGLVDAARRLRSSHGAPEWDDVGVERAMGEIARRTGDLHGAVEIARTTLEHSLTDRGRSRMLNLLGSTSAALGDLDTAYDACSRELELNRVVGYDGYIASAEGNLAEVAMRIGDIPTAARHQKACLELAVSTGSTAMVAFSLIVAARIAGESSDWPDALRLHAKAESMLEELGLALYADDLAESERLLGDAAAGLGADTFGRERAAGSALEVTEAIDTANRVLVDASHGP